MSLSALRSVGDAIDATREFLFPLSARRWGALAVAVAFMGTAGTPVPANPQFVDPRLWQGPTEAPPGADPATPPPDESVLPSLAELLPELLAVTAVVAALALAYVVVGVLARFVLVEALATDEVALLRDAGRHLRGAAGIVVLRAVLWGVAGVAALGAVVAGTPLLGDPLAGAARWLVLGAAGTVGFLTWLVDAVTLQFVVPVMVAEGRGVLAGWRRFWPVLLDEWVEYGVYAVVRLVVGVAVGIVSALAFLLVVLALGLVFGTVAGAIVLLAGGYAAVGGATLAALLVVVAAFLVSAIVAFALVNVPFQCYLWYYALFVLGDTDPDLDLIADVRALVRGDDPGVAPV